MIYPRLLGTVAVTFGLLAAQQSPEDPVMKIRAQRAEASGEQDLPPVPRTVMEPPPLPPPEVHLKDTRGYRANKGKRVKVSTGRKGRKGKAAVAKQGKTAAVKKGKASPAKKGAPKESKAHRPRKSSSGKK